MKGIPSNSVWQTEHLKQDGWYDLPSAWIICIVANATLLMLKQYKMFSVKVAGFSEPNVNLNSIPKIL